MFLQQVTDLSIYWLIPSAQLCPHSPKWGSTKNFLYNVNNNLYFLLVFRHKFCTVFSSITLLSLLFCPVITDISPFRPASMCSCKVCTVFPFAVKLGSSATHCRIGAYICSSFTSVISDCSWLVCSPPLSIYSPNKCSTFWISFSTSLLTVSCLWFDWSSFMNGLPTTILIRVKSPRVRTVHLLLHHCYSWNTIFQK